MNASRSNTLRRVALAKRVIEWLIVALVLFELGMMGRVLARDRDTAPAEQHRYIDTVLVPRFYAAWSDWALQHPQDKDGKQGSHYFTIDAGDVRRGHAMRAAMKELYDRLSEIGY
jgi:hypothetical protein